MLVLPKNLGSLTLHRKIGTGTVAESYLATGTDGKPAVVRRILPFIVKDPSRKAGIEARVAELSGFRHPALVHVNGVVEEGGETFIVEEYVDGVSLERLITDGRTPRSNGSIAAPVMEPSSTRRRRKARAQFHVATALVLPASEVSSAQQECWPRMRAGSAPQQRSRRQILREEDL